MKKSLLALAALTAVSAASAQSNLNLYGVADLWVGHVKAAGVSSTQMGSGGLAGSRLGFKGTEDLGGGLKANFVLEQGIDLTNGQAAGFDRQAFLGLSGGFGAVQFGNTYTALDDINGAANSGFDSALSATSGVWVGYNSNPGSNIKYITPTFGGFSAAASMNLDDNGSAARVASLQGAYNNGPIYAGAAYQSDKQTTAGVDARHVLVNGSYDLGSVKLLGSYRNVQRAAAFGAVYPNVAGSGRTDEFQFGVDVPLSSAMTLSAGYAQSKDAAGGVQLEKRTGLGLALGYSMSKRTTVYAGVQQAKAKMAGTKDHLAAVGVNHNF